MKTTTIPVPDNPQHVDNLKSISLLKSQGWDGPDADLATSLFEYGMAWREIGDETLFIYQHPSIPNRFDRCSLDSKLDVQREYDWVRWTEFMSYVDMPLHQWLALPITMKIFDLVGYYGTDEIFGSSYWEGFSISEE